jgi:hypothetical protein
MRELYEIELHMHGDVIKKHLEAMKAELDALPKLGPYGITVEYNLEAAFGAFVDGISDEIDLGDGREDETDAQSSERSGAVIDFIKFINEWRVNLFRKRKPVGQAAFLAGIVKQELGGKL